MVHLQCCELVVLIGLTFNRLLYVLNSGAAIIVCDEILTPDLVPLFPALFFVTQYI